MSVAEGIELFLQFGGFIIMLIGLVLQLIDANSSNKKGRH